MQKQQYLKYILQELKREENVNVCSIISVHLCILLRLSGAIGISVILELFLGYFYSSVLFTVHYLISQQAKNIQNKKKVEKKFRKYKK